MNTSSGERVCHEDLGTGTLKKLTNVKCDESLVLDDKHQAPVKLA